MTPSELNEIVATAENGIEMCRFIPVSSLPISEEAKSSISQSGSITFGDANRTMVTLERIKGEIDSYDFETNERDAAIMDALIAKLGPNFYVDLEN